MDLIVRNARLVTNLAAGPVDIGIAGGTIAAIEKGLAAEAEVYDAGGRLACAGLIETHIHLDKSRILDRAPPETVRKINPMKQVAALKPGFTVEDVRARAERTLTECILNGATRMRTQVEVDPAIGLRGFQAVRSVSAEYRWAIDVEICVFPQDGLTNYPGTDELLVEALKRGARASAAPRVTTPTMQVRSGAFSSSRESSTSISTFTSMSATPPRRWTSTSFAN